MLSRHRHPDHRQVGPGGHHARQVGGAAGRGDHNFDASFASGRGPFHDPTGVAVRRADLHLVRKAKLVKHFDARLHERQV